MARKVEQFTDGVGRDKGKRYTLTEMPVYQSEKMAIRAMMLAIKAGVDIPDDVKGKGIAGLALMGLQALMRGLDFRDLDPLLDEMLPCITFNPDPRNPQVERALVDGDIEEIHTLLAIRGRLIDMHWGFSEAGDPSTMPGSASPADARRSHTRTFRRSPGQRSRPAKQHS